MRKEDFFEVLGELDDDIVEGAKIPMKVSKNNIVVKHGWIKWASAAACFCLILTAAMVTFSGILKGPDNIMPPADLDTGVTVSDKAEPNSTDPSQLPEEPLETTSVQPSGGQNVIINWDSVFVNESDSTPLDAARLNYDPDLYAEEDWGREEIVSYSGWDLAPGYIPEGLSDGGQGVAAGIWREKATGEIVEEQAGRGFWADFWEDGSPKSNDDLYIPAGFTIIASKLGILHCALLPVEESKTTDFDGVPVTLSHCSMPHGPFDPTKKAPNGHYNMPAGYYDIYVASFTLDGVKYELEAQRLELEEVIKIVASVINIPSSEDFVVGKM